MFFTYAARILSILALILGLWLVLAGLTIANGWTGLPYDVALARYAPNFSSSGKAIDKGTLYIVFAVALGTLSEIGFAVRKSRD
jgi:hypothetical protein